MFGMGLGEWTLILAVVVFLFGARKIPQLGAAFGKTIHGFKEGLKSKQEELKDGKGI